MTREEIMQMKPGRELDELVAEQVMSIQLQATNGIAIGKAVFSGFQGNSPRGVYNDMTFIWNNAPYEIHIKGSKYYYGGADGNAGYGLWLWENREGEAWKKDIEVHVSQWRKTPINYSDDISAAWEVVEKMVKEWSDYCVGTREGKWVVSWGFDGYGWQWVEDCETAPLAICKASLLAVLKL